LYAASGFRHFTLSVSVDVNVQRTSADWLPQSTWFDFVIEDAAAFLVFPQDELSTENKTAFTSETKSERILRRWRNPTTQ
jgi:hypothetical protein